MQEVLDVESKGSVAFARVFAGMLAVNPDRGRVKHGFKLDSYCGARPALRSIKTTAVPGNAPILSQGRLDLPGVGHADLQPIGRQSVCREPILVCPSILGIGAEQPRPGKAGGLSGAQAQESCLRPQLHEGPLGRRLREMPFEAGIRGGNSQDTFVHHYNSF